MGFTTGNWCGLLVAVVGLPVACGGCSWYEGVVEQQDLRLHTPMPTRSAPAYARVAEPMAEPTAERIVVAQAPAANTSSREVGALRVELNTAQENNRHLRAKIGELEDTVAARDKKIEELRGQVAEMEKRLKATDADWQRRQADLRQSMDAQQKQALDAMADKMAQEMAEALKAQQQAQKPTVAGVHTVRQGEVLSIIAAAYRVPLKDLMAINGLKNDTIRVGQKLKIPAPKR